MTKESVFQQLLAAGWPLLVDVALLAEAFSTSENAIRIAINRGKFKIATRREGRRIVASLADVAAHIAAQAPSTPTPPAQSAPRRRGRPRKEGL